MLNKNTYDAVVIGGGFYGCIIALFLKRKFKRVLLIEKGSDLLLKASYNNQARIHNGYHYPRSHMTALRSHINYSRFISDFKDAACDKYLMIYAIAANNSKVTAGQYVKFCKSIGIPLSPAADNIRKLFNDRLIEEVFVVDEAVFNAGKIRDILKKKLFSAGVKVIYRKEVTKVTSAGQLLTLYLKNDITINSKSVYNCTYSAINQILTNSSLPKLPLKHELTEMPLIQMPGRLKNMGITVMDGPFFSIMPFPDLKMHTIHHVRYTPHYSTLDNLDNPTKPNSEYTFMIKDAIRYIPELSKVKYKTSIYETKSVLIADEITDARPILFKKDYVIKNFHVILGAKIDNIYDVVEEIDKNL
ncbi:FAD-dependent oxidoreductase [Candidatus Daviesbacteria bacterium]|nr:FAD-dependent oxidoreductase [Candidatus Daviesbacteria bacterium]